MGIKLINIDENNGPANKKYLEPYLSDRYPKTGWVKLFEILAVDVKMLIINKDKLNLIARIGISPIIKLEYKSVTAWLPVAIPNSDFLLVLCIISKILLY